VQKPPARRVYCVHSFVTCSAPLRGKGLRQSRTSALTIPACTFGLRGLVASLALQPPTSATSSRGNAIRYVILDLIQLESRRQNAFALDLTGIAPHDRPTPSAGPQTKIRERSEEKCCPRAPGNALIAGRRTSGPHLRAAETAVGSAGHPCPERKARSFPRQDRGLPLARELERAGATLPRSDVYAIRNALGSDCILASGRELRLNPDLITVDVWDVRGSDSIESVDAAAGCYNGPLLDGVHIAGQPRARVMDRHGASRLRTSIQTAVELLANRAAETGDHSQQRSVVRRLASSDPLSADVTKKLMRALAVSGDRVAR